MSFTCEPLWSGLVPNTRQNRIQAFEKSVYLCGHQFCAFLSVLGLQALSYENMNENIKAVPILIRSVHQFFFV